jgi:hypothetical protein
MFLVPSHPSCKVEQPVSKSTSIKSKEKKYVRCNLICLKGFLCRPRANAGRARETDNIEGPVSARTVYAPGAHVQLWTHPPDGFAVTWSSITFYDFFAAYRNRNAESDTSGKTRTQASGDQSASWRWTRASNRAASVSNAPMSRFLAC